MNKLVSNLLLIFRSSTGVQKIIKTDFNLGDLLADCASNLKKSYPQKQLTLNLPAEAEIRADEDYLKRVINNLLENAAKNTAPDGEIDIKLSASADHFVLKVKDNGIGMKKEQQKQIFNAYYQVEQGKAGGVGLGLAIVKWAVDAHKGKISIESEPGKGATFTVTLPKR